jgi:hypothetical protein
MLSRESKNRGFFKKNKELGRKKAPPMLSAKARIGGLQNGENKGVMNIFDVILAKKEEVKRILS